MLKVNKWFINEKKERLDTSDDPMKLLYDWVLDKHINMKEFQILSDYTYEVRNQPCRADELGI